MAETKLTYLVLKIDEELGMTISSSGNTLSIPQVSDIPSGAPPGNKGLVCYINGGVLTIYVWDTDTTAWIALSGGGGASPLTTKGDVYTYSTVNARLPVGTNGQALIADSAETTGLKWTSSVEAFDGGAFSDTARVTRMPSPSPGWKQYLYQRFNTSSICVQVKKYLRIIS